MLPLTREQRRRKDRRMMFLSFLLPWATNLKMQHIHCQFRFTMFFRKGCFRWDLVSIITKLNRWVLLPYGRYILENWTGEMLKCRTQMAIVNYSGLLMALKKVEWILLHIRRRLIWARKQVDVLANFNSQILQKKMGKRPVQQLRWSRWKLTRKLWIRMEAKLYNLIFRRVRKSLINCQLRIHRVLRLQ